MIEYNSELVEAARRRDNDDPSFYADFCSDRGAGIYYPDEVTKVVVKENYEDKPFDLDFDGEFADGSGKWMWLAARRSGGATGVLDDADKRRLAQSSTIQKVYDDYIQEDIADDLSRMGDREIAGLTMYNDPEDFNDALQEVGIGDVRVIRYYGAVQGDFGDVLVKGNIEQAKDTISHWNDVSYDIELYRAPDTDYAARDWYELVEAASGFYA